MKTKHQLPIMRRIKLKWIQLKKIAYHIHTLNQNQPSNTIETLIVIYIGKKKLSRNESAENQKSNPQLKKRNTPLSPAYTIHGGRTIQSKSKDKRKIATG